ncbi:MAG: SurA N-terminal domain-containing protein [Syntrophobacterales bacterium]
MSARSKRWGKIVFLLGVWLCFFWSAAAAKVVERIVAVVNDEVISQSEVDQMAKAIESQPGAKLPPGSGKKLERRLLDALIMQKLAKAEAKRRGITVSDKEVEKALEQFKKRNGIQDDETLSRMLAKNGMTLKSFKQQLADQMTQERLLAVVAGSKVVVTDNEVRQFYEQEYPKTSGKMLHLRMLNMPLPAEKHGVMIQDLGFVAERDLDPELAQFLSKVKPGETAPVETLQGFRLVEVVARREGRARSFEDVAPEIRAFLQRREMEKTFQDWIKSQKDRAHIKIMM